MGARARGRVTRTGSWHGLFAIWIVSSACGDAVPAPAAAAAESDRPAPASADTACELVQRGMPLPHEVRESSGLARSTLDDGLFWSHNDAGNSPHIFAFDEEGTLRGQVRVTGAELVDWEDIESGPCDGGGCLYIGDIGDNDAERDSITVYRVAEPPTGAAETDPAVALHARFPDGPQDAEGLFLDGSGTPHLITKGRRGRIALYRWPASTIPGETVTLVRVRDLFPEPRDELDRVTAATATPDRRWVGVRTYRALYLYPAQALLGGGPIEPAVVDLSALAQPQGESLVLADDGAVWLSSEAEKRGERPRWSRLRCAFPQR